MDIDSLKLASTPEQIRHLETYVKRLTERYHISDDLYPNILISLTEAVNNAIIHGNNNDKSKFVDICFNKSRESFIFKVSDQGSGFNPTAIPDPTLPENIECCGGRGVFLMKSLSDRVEYCEDGNTVEICFHIHK